MRMHTLKFSQDIAKKCSALNRPDGAPMSLNRYKGEFLFLITLKKIFFYLIIFADTYPFWTFTRYKNILPYDHTRITLKEAFIYPGTEDEKCDYVNASWITNSDGKEANGNKSNSTKTRKVPDPCSNISFMACQGPTPVTCHYHLQMIHEQRADIVVMLTRLVEVAGQGISGILNFNRTIML